MSRDSNPHVLDEDYLKDSEILRKVHSIYTSNRFIDFSLLSRVNNLRRLFNEYIYLIYLEIHRQEPDSSVIESILLELENSIPLTSLDTEEPLFDFIAEEYKDPGTPWNRFYSFEFLGDLCLDLLKNNFKIEPVLSRTNSEEEKLIFFEILCYVPETQELNPDKFEKKKSLLDSKLEILYFHANRLSHSAGGMECLNALAMITNKLDRLLISGIIYTELLTRIDYINDEEEKINCISMFMTSLTLMDKEEPFNKFLFPLIDHLDGVKDPESISPIITELEFGLRKNPKLTISDSNFKYLLLLVRLNFHPAETMKNLTAMASIRNTENSNLEAQYLLEEALSYYPELEGLLLEEDPLLYIAEVAIKNGDQDFAYTVCDRILEYCNDIEDIEARADELTTLGSIILQFELLEKEYGLKFIRRSLELVGTREEILFKGNFLFKISIILWNSGHLDILKSQLLYVIDDLLSRGISGNLSNELRVAEHLCITECLMILGEDRKSLDLFKNVITESVHSVKDSTHIMLIGNTCKTFLNFGTLENSLEILLIILENIQELKNARFKSALIFDFMDSLLNSYKIEVNLEYCMELLKVVKTMEDPEYRGRTYFLFSKKMKSLGEIELSEDLFSEGI